MVLRVFDNSAEVAPGMDIPQPLLVLEMIGGRLAFPAPDDPRALDTTPEWARSIVQAALEHQADPAA